MHKNEKPGRRRDTLIWWRCYDFCFWMDKRRFTIRQSIFSNWSISRNSLDWAWEHVLFHDVTTTFRKLSQLAHVMCLRKFGLSSLRAFKSTTRKKSESKSTNSNSGPSTVLIASGAVPPSPDVVILPFDKRATGRIPEHNAMSRWHSNNARLPRPPPPTDCLIDFLTNTTLRTFRYLQLKSQASNKS